MSEWKELLMADEIPEGWKECRLGDIAEVVGGGTPKTDVAEYWNGEIPWITPRDLSNFKGRYISKGERNISEKGLIHSSAKILPKGTILLSTRAPVGYLAIAENNITTNQGFRSLVPFDYTNNIFLYYLLKNNIEYLKSQATGTTFGELAGSVLKSLIFPIPPLPEQRAIAGVLSSLDDKIDLLHRENKTLEQMAEALFRQWFIEEAEDSWEESMLGDVVTISYGKNLPINKLLSNGYPVFGAGGQIGLYNEYLYEDPQVLVSCRGTAGEVNISLPKSFITNNSLVLERNKRSEITFEYLKYHSLYYDFTPYVSGSVQPQITINDLYRATFLIPPVHLIDKFSKIVRSYEKKRSNNIKQIRTLEKLRDTLLPKLMSGEVRVAI